MEVLGLGQFASPLSNAYPVEMYRAVQMVVNRRCVGRISGLEEYNTDLPLLDGAFGSLLDVLPLPLINSGGDQPLLYRLTIDAMLAKFLTSLTATVCTRNLSRHFASSGGSSFIA